MTGFFPPLSPFRVLIGRASARLRLLLVAVLLLMITFRVLVAQEELLPVLHFNRLTTADGLPTNEIRSNVVRDSAGFIWVGTYVGLARYDGHSCRVYRHEAGDPYSLSSNSILRLLVDSKGRLWVGTYASGPSLYDPARDRFVNFLPRKNDSLWFSGHYVDSFMEENPGRIWIGISDGEVVRFDLGAAANQTDPDSIARYLQVRSVGDSRFNGLVRNIVPWDEEHVLASTGGGLFLVDRRTLNVTRPVLPRLPAVKLDTIPAPRLLYEDTRRLWIGTILHGLYLLDRGKGSLVAFHKGTKDGRIQDLQIDNSGQMWIATGEGVDLFDTRSGSYKDYLPAWEAPGKSSFIQMSLDSSGILWISTDDDGVYFLSPAWFRFPHYGLRGPTGRPREMSTIDRADDGSFWVGTEGKVARIHLGTMQAERMIEILGGKKPSSGVSSFRTSLVDRKGTLWYGTWGLGLFSFEPRTGSVRNFRISDQLKDLAFNMDVFISLMKRGPDTLWIAAFNDGLLAFDTQTGRFSKVPDISMAQPWKLITDRNGTIWVADQFSGVFTFDPGSMRWNLFDYGTLGNPIPYGVYEDPKGRLWIGTNPINLWVPETKSFKPIPNKTFENAEFVVPLGSDVRGRLWVRYGDKGLSLLDPKSSLFTNFDLSDGLLFAFDMESLDDGRVMLVGYKGMTLVHPDSLFSPGRVPRLLLSRMQINDTMSVPIHGLPSSHMVLRHDQNTLEFGFSAIDPGQGHLIAYSYRLEGLEDAWAKAGDRRYVRYPGLAPGDYVFRVKAASMLARWPDRELALAITITPPWWKTTAFQVALAVSIASLLVFVYRREVTRARREKLIQQQFTSQQLVFQEAERKRVASEIHDGLGQSLLIAANELRQIVHDKSRSLHRLNQVTSILQQSIDSAREISVNLHPHHLDRFGLTTAIKALARTSAHGSAAVIETECDEVDEVLSKTARLHLYRIIQEALANAVRHAKAKKIVVHVGKDGGAIRAVIRDDGIGFIVNDFAAAGANNSAEDLHRGFGLSSLSERARIIGATLTIESTPGSGTLVSVLVPFTKG